VTINIRWEVGGEMVTVGERVTNKEVEIWDQNQTKDGRVRFAVDVDVEVFTEPTKQDQHAPQVPSQQRWTT